MHDLARRLGLRTNPLIFFWSSGLMLFVLAVLLMFPGPIGAAFSAGREWITFNLGWFFVIGVTAWLVFLVWAVFAYRRPFASGGLRPSVASDGTLVYVTDELG